MNKKLRGLVEGNEYGFYGYDGKLCVGTIHLCEKCQAPASVNSMQVMSANRQTMTKLAKSAILFESAGYVIGELEATEDGFYLCGDCYGKHEVQ